MPGHDALTQIRPETAGGSSPATSGPSPRGRRYALLFGAIAIALAMAGLAGWVLNNLTLAALLPGAIPMAPFTAASILVLTVTALGTVAGAWRGTSRWAAAAAASVVGLLGLTVMLKLAPGGGLDLEGLVLPEMGRIGPFPLGRMSPSTGAAILLAAISTLLSLRHIRHGIGRAGALTAATLGLGSAALGLVFTAGYAVGAPLLYQTSTIPMALSTGLAMIGLGLVCVLAAGREAVTPLFGAPESVQSRIVRRFLPVLFAVMAVQLIWIPAALQLPFLDAPLAVAVAFTVLTVAAGIVIARSVRSVSRRIESTEAALRRSEELYRKFFDHAADAILVADADSGVIVDANRQAEALTGRDRDELIGMHQIRIHPPDGGGRHRAGRRFSADAPTGAVRELEVVRRDGRRIPVEVSSAGTVDRGGRRLHIGYFRDLSARRELEARARQAEKMDAIGQLAGGIAHDFNNQLSAILGSAELLAARAEDPELRRQVERIASSAHRAGDLTRQLLAFAHRGAYRREEVDVDDVVHAVVTLLERSVDKSVRIEHRRWHEPAIISGDPAQLQTALLDLGLNARDAMPEGGDLVFTVRTTRLDGAPAGVSPALSPGRYVTVEVRDTGVGMTDEVRRRAFEPFFSTKPAGTATGMGLAAAYGTVSRCGGGIGVASRPGEGTVVTVFLPVTDGVRTPSGPLPPVRRDEPRRARVVVVDDEEAVREAIVEMAEMLGHSAAGYGDGAEALAAFDADAGRFDLVVLDLTMPGMSGREVFAALRARRTDLPVVLSSGHSLEDEAREMLQQGPVAFLQKPYRLADLRTTIERLLAQAGG